VLRLMLEAFAEYDGVLEPRSSALDETVEDVLAVMAKGGAVLAWANGEAVGSGRYELRGGGLVYIGRLSVSPAFRGRGTAAAMVRFIEDAARDAGCREATLDVRMALPRTWRCMNGSAT
jgi:GNAT superfamily N-acetyltransferase